MCAYGTTSCPRCDLVERADLSGKESTMVDLHRAGSDVETTVESAVRMNSLL